MLDKMAEIEDQKKKDRERKKEKGKKQRHIYGKREIEH